MKNVIWSFSGSRIVLEHNGLLTTISLFLRLIDILSLFVGLIVFMIWVFKILLILVIIPNPNMLSTTNQKKEKCMYANRLFSVSLLCNTE